MADKRDLDHLAGLRGQRCRKSEEQLAQYLIGNWRDEHLINLEKTLDL